MTVPVARRPPLTRACVLSFGYFDARRLPRNRWIGIQRQLYTVALDAEINAYGWSRRWCYGTEAEALAAMHVWDGHGDPPGLWIKRRHDDTLNPEWLATQGIGEGSTP